VKTVSDGVVRHSLGLSLRAKMVAGEWPQMLGQTDLLGAKTLISIDIRS